MFSVETSLAGFKADETRENKSVNGSGIPPPEPTPIATIDTAGKIQRDNLNRAVGASSSGFNRSAMFLLIPPNARSEREDVRQSIATYGALWLAENLCQMTKVLNRSRETLGSILSSFSPRRRKKTTAGIGVPYAMASATDRQPDGCSGMCWRLDDRLDFTFWQLPQPPEARPAAEVTDGLHRYRRHIYQFNPACRIK
jgi:hypothetical protein